MTILSQNVSCFCLYFLILFDENIMFWRHHKSLYLDRVGKSGENGFTEKKCNYRLTTNLKSWSNLQLVKDWFAWVVYLLNFGKIHLRLPKQMLRSMIIRRIIAMDEYFNRLIGWPIHTLSQRRTSWFPYSEKWCNKTSVSLFIV